MRAVILLGIISCGLVGFSSCSIKEPQGEFCVVISAGTKHCVPTDTSRPEFDTPIKLGDFIVSPEFFGELSDHHKELHVEVDECGN